jgi:DNA-binding LytR/AlgR family response regulator
MKILIIEDELPARKKLKRFIQEISVEHQQEIEIIGELDRVETAIDFLQDHHPDLIFSDIELLDGLAIEIFKVREVNCPVIFTTAYHQYWMEALEGNGIDYLLKPLSRERFEKAWLKFMKFSFHLPSVDQDSPGPMSPKNQRDQENSSYDNVHQKLLQLAAVLEERLGAPSFKKRITIQNHQGIFFLDTDTITFFQAHEGVIFAHDETGKKHLLNFSSLKEIEDQVNPQDFFKINRGELVGKIHIQRVERYNKNTVAIQVKGHPEWLKTSQNATSQFNDWLKL